jgi:hypothetical protein
MMVAIRGIGRVLRSRSAECVGSVSHSGLAIREGKNPQNELVVRVGREVHTLQRRMGLGFVEYRFVVRKAG